MRTSTWTPRSWSASPASHWAGAVSRAVAAPREEASGPSRRITAMMVVLGIDPGTAHTGYGVVAHHQGRLVALDGGVIGTPAGLELPRRLVAIHARVGELLAAYGPDAV